MAKNMAFEVVFDKNFAKDLKRLNEGIEKANKRALYEALKSGATAFSSAKKGGAPKHYNVKAKEVKEVTKVHNDSIVIRSRKYTIGTSSHFSHYPSRYKSMKGIPVRKRPLMRVTIRTANKRKAFPHAFIANPAKVKHGKTFIWLRGKDKHDIQPVRSMSPAGMARVKVVYEAIQKVMVEQYNKRFSHHYDREVAKIAKH